MPIKVVVQIHLQRTGSGTYELRQCMQHQFFIAYFMLFKTIDLLVLLLINRNDFGKLNFSQQ